MAKKKKPAVHYERWLTRTRAAAALVEMKEIERGRPMEYQTGAYVDGRRTRARRVAKEALKQAQQQYLDVVGGRADVNGLLDYLLKQYRECFSWNCTCHDSERGVAEFNILEEVEELQYLDSYIRRLLRDNVEAPVGNPARRIQRKCTQLLAKTNSRRPLGR